MMSGPAAPTAARVQMKLADALKQAQAHFAKGELVAAERYAAAIVAKRPQHMLANQILAAIAEKRGQREAAVAILARSLAGTNADVLPLMNLCRVLRLTGRLEEARQAGERAVAIGTVPDAMVDLADAYTALGDCERARVFYERAVAKRPNLARARLGLAQSLLQTGDFRAGWAEYEWRYKMPSTENVLPKFKQPQWNGMALKSSRLLIIAEQGYGDCFQFARYLPMVCERVKDVFVGNGLEIHAVLRSAAPSLACFERWEHIPPFDFQITMSSLPLVFGTTLETIPAVPPYLFADQTKAAAWRTKLGAAAQGRKTVGIVWQGRPTHPNDRVRSLALSTLTPLLELDGIMPVSLQVGAGREQLAQHPAKLRVFDAADELKDFGDTAALIANLDCVVTIDSAIAHLTGGLGKRGVVMLPRAAEWRWLIDRADSPWYPTLELVRQGADANWAGVVQRVVERLRA
jgi:tetratricopeptide (TPR) repeat protein